MTQRCTGEWAEIKRISAEENPSPETMNKLAVGQHKIHSWADYQQAKLIPHCGRNEQAASTYYSQRIPTYL